MKQIKKGSAELISIVIAVTVIGSLALGIAAFLGNSTKDAQTEHMGNATDNAISAINAM